MATKDRFDGPEIDRIFIDEFPKWQQYNPPPKFKLKALTLETHISFLFLFGWNIIAYYNIKGNQWWLFFVIPVAYILMTLYISWFVWGLNKKRYYANKNKFKFKLKK